LENSFQTCDLSIEEAEARAAQDRIAGFYTLVGALVRRDDRKLFAQRRSLSRKFGPGLWDNVGGHVEGGETLYNALQREMQEETGWSLKKIFKVIAIRNWHDSRGASREYIVICDAEGDMDNPVLEHEKVDQFLWIGSDNIDILQQNRPIDDLSQIAIYKHALSVMS
jgi:8-oxo-dGTP diphosphatase